MATQRSIKNRIRSTKSIKQITKAMEAVSAVKMRKSEHTALRARPYALAALEILRSLTAGTDSELSSLSPFLNAPKGKPELLLVVTSDKGLAGSFNTNVLRKTQNFLKEHTDVEIVTVGKKGRAFLGRRGHKIAADYTGAGDFIELSETAPISAFVRKHFSEGRFSSVTLLYTNFLSALKQEVVARKILPFNYESLNAIIGDITPIRGKYANMPAVLGTSKVLQLEYAFEPSPYVILNELLPALLDIEIHHAILEGNASEHSSRMIAMRNASLNAGELIDNLTLEYNKARQAQITKELIEVTAGREALEA